VAWLVTCASGPKREAPSSSLASSHCARRFLQWLCLHDGPRHPERDTWLDPLLDRCSTCARIVRLQRDNGERFTTIVTAGLSMWNIGLAFVTGLIVFYSIKRGWIRL
jgi:hypothetical protein